ncbi:MAG TPA: hypothetical protein VJ723_11870 [Candidatus Angelobacter sp.]|nr:hypothetical protein [Candidatus Angelobacter sp.]
MVTLLLIAGVSAQQTSMSREEKAVRAAYTKVAYAAQSPSEPRNQARIGRDEASEAGRWAYDVFFATR